MKIVLTSVSSDVLFLFRTIWLTIRGIRVTITKHYGIFFSGQRFSHSTPSHPSLVKITPFVSCAELALAIFFFSRANSLEKYTNQFSIAVNRKAIYFLEFSCISGGKCLDQGGNGLVGD